MPEMVASTRQRFLRLLPLFQQLSTAAGVPWDLVAAIAWRESDYDATARNRRTQAAGLMQIMPDHHAELGLTGGRWADPAANIRAGIQVLKWHGLGKKPIDQVLRGYGGFVTVDPGPYIRAVNARREVVRQVAAAAGGAPQPAAFQRVASGGSTGVGGGIRQPVATSRLAPAPDFWGWLRSLFRRR